MDIMLEMAQEVAAEIGAVIVDGRCDCGWVLIEKPEQGMPFCWGCTTDKQTAMEGRALLLRARLAEKGIMIPADKAWRAAEETEKVIEPQGCLGIGMPL